MPDDAVPVGVVAPGPSELGLALDLVAATFGFHDVQELCTAMEAYIDQRNSQGASGAQPEPAAAGKPQNEGAEASGPDAPDVKTGPVTAPDVGAAAPASVFPSRRRGAKGGTQNQEA